MQRTSSELEDGLALRSGPGRIALTATVAASAMASLDATVVNVALPHIGSQFHATVTSLQWVLTGYLLALASLIVLGGALGDRFGRRRIFMIGTAWFAGASLLCGAAPDIEVLVGARVLQGVGGALLTPGSLAILQSSFRRSDRAAAVGAWSGFGGVAGAIGPFVGGSLVEGPGWRWVFLINVPVGMLALWCAGTAVPESRNKRATGRLDVTGAVLAIAALALLTWALTEAGPRGWADIQVLTAIALGAAAIVAFVLHLRRARHPLVPLDLFASRTFDVVNLGTAFLYGAIGLTFFLMTYELQVAARWSAIRAGLALLPATVLMLLFSRRSGTLAQRHGPRLQLAAGPVIAGTGLMLLTRVGPHPDWATDVLPGAVVFGVGLVTFVAPLTAAVMGAAPREHLSVASGVNNAIARAASLLSLAVVPAVAGLSTAHGPTAVTHAVRQALVIAGITAAVAGPLMLIGLSAQTRGPRVARRVHCAVDGPPLQADPSRCPTVPLGEAVEKPSPHPSN